MVVFYVVSCKQENSNLEFTIPKLLNSQNLNRIELQDTNQLYGAELPLEIGIYSFKDTLIDLNKPSTEVRVSYAARVLDMSQPKEKLFKYEKQIETSVFDVIPNYEDHIEYLYKGKQFTMYPVFLVNSTDHELIYGSHSVYKGSDEMFWDKTLGNWIRIQSLGSNDRSFCGCCSYFLRVYPNEYLVLLVPKHQRGQIYDMKMKLSFGVNESIVYQGIIDTSLYVYALKNDSTLFLRLKSNEYYKP